MEFASQYIFDSGEGEVDTVPCKLNRYGYGSMSERQSPNAGRTRGGGSGYSGGRIWASAPVDADTNVACVRISKLVTSSSTYPCQPISCCYCKAIFNQFSVIDDPSGEPMTWCCEFCQYRNAIRRLPTELIGAGNANYLLAPSMSAEPGGADGEEDGLIVFCLDISGSMGATHRSSRPMMIKSYGTGIWRPLTLVTRLQAVQAALERQLTALARNQPHRRVSIITFDDSVTVLNDGSYDSVPVIKGAAGLREEGLALFGSRLSTPGPIGETCLQLLSQINRLEEGGFSAVESALVVAVAFASKTPRSKILLCTDGETNVGMVGADRLSEKLQRHEDLGKHAADKGVSVSVVTFADVPCNLAQISLVADLTNGQVSTVNLEELEGEFRDFLRNDVLATNAVAKVIVDKKLYIHHHDWAVPHLLFDLGNVTTTCDVTFKFGVRINGTTSPQKLTPEMHLASSSTVAVRDGPVLGPCYFQTQVKFTDLQGRHILCVCTSKMPLTTNATLTLDNVDCSIIGLHGAQHAGRLMYMGNMSSASRVLEAHKELLLSLRGDSAIVQRYESILRLSRLRSESPGIMDGTEDDVFVAACYQRMKDSLKRYQDYTITSDESNMSSSSNDASPFRSSR